MIARRTTQQAVTWFLRTLHTHPLLLSTATLTGFSILGLVGWNLLESRQQQQQQPHDGTMSLQEAQLRAMIENARTSTWQENLDNAATANERFMLPGRRPHDDQETAAFMASIEAKKAQILEQHQQAQNLKDETTKQCATDTRFW